MYLLLYIQFLCTRWTTPSVSQVPLNGMLAAPFTSNIDRALSRNPRATQRASTWVWSDFAFPGPCPSLPTLPGNPKPFFFHTFFSYVLALNSTTTSVAEKLECHDSDGDDENTLECLRKVPMERLIDVAMECTYLISLPRSAMGRLLTFAGNS